LGVVEYELSFTFTSGNAHGPVPDNKCGNEHCPISIGSINPSVTQSQKERERKNFLCSVVLA
jgi:hypothetical protein